MRRVVEPQKEDSSDDELCGRSMTQEVDYSDIKSASKQIYHENKKSIAEAKQRQVKKSLLKSFQEDRKSNIGSTRSSYNNVLSQKSKTAALSHRSMASSRKSKLQPLEAPQAQSVAAFATQDEKMQAMMSLLQAFNSISQDDDKVEKLRHLLLSNFIMQDCLTEIRKHHGKEAIDFGNVKSTADLQDVSFDQMIEAIQAIKINVDGNDPLLYEREKERYQKQGFSELEGVNQLVYERNHDYLRDMQTQQKRKFFPTNADTSNEFSNLHLPASKYCKDSNVFKDNSNTPMSGQWYHPKREVASLEPAGRRIPTDYKVE